LATYQFVNTFARQIKAPIKCIKSDVFKFIENCTEQFDVIFCDPPYDLSGIESLAPLIFKKSLLLEGGVLIIEHSKETILSNLEGFEEQRAYGKVNFSFFSC
jgi:16S rRNA G966 N2-methylase RsmD